MVYTIILIIFKIFHRRYYSWETPTTPIPLCALIPFITISSGMFVVIDIFMHFAYFRVFLSFSVLVAFIEHAFPLPMEMSDMRRAALIQCDWFAECIIFFLYSDMFVIVVEVFVLFISFLFFVFPFSSVYLSFWFRANRFGCLLQYQF